MYATVEREMQTEKDIARLSLPRIDWLRKEVSRIANATLRGNFEKQDDLQYWVNQLKKLNGELLALELAAKVLR